MKMYLIFNQNAFLKKVNIDIYPQLNVMYFILK